MTKVAVLLAMLPVAAHASDPVHCYVTSEPPADAPFTTATPMPMDRFGDMVSITLSRIACGTVTDAHKAALVGKVERALCSEDSEAMAFARDMNAADPAPLKAQFMASLDMDEAGFSNWCAAMNACEPNADHSYNPDCFEALASGRSQ